jgi:hypothetical protein
MLPKPRNFIRHIQHLFFKPLRDTNIEVLDMLVLLTHLCYIPDIIAGYEK